MCRIGTRVSVKTARKSFLKMRQYGPQCKAEAGEYRSYSKMAEARPV